MRGANRTTAKQSSAKKNAHAGKNHLASDNDLPAKLLILDQDLIGELIRDRQERGIDQHDEIWEGVYVVPPLANNVHQGLVTALTFVLYVVINLENRGAVFPGANISDRKAGWKRKFRAPDVVVVLKEGRAIDCNTHWMDGPDFLIEVQSPGEQIEEKIPFYEQLHVRELLIIQRDTRELRLLRHDGQRLTPVQASFLQGGKWLVSEVVPLAFRRRSQHRSPVLDLQRTDGIPGNWSI